MSPGLQTTTPGRRSEEDPCCNGVESVSDDGACLDTAQLVQLELSFRRWADATSRQDVRLARRRILLIFLLIRHTGAKLNEILRLDPFTDIDAHSVCIHDPTSPEPCARRISIAENLSQEIRATLDDPHFRSSLTKLFAVDPAFVRRKFYECAKACGLPKRLSGPEMIRRARAVELPYFVELEIVDVVDGFPTVDGTTPFVLESEYPNAHDQDVPWWWKESRLDLRERESG